MIAKYLIDALYAVLQWIYSLLPAYTGLPSGISSAYYTFSGFTGKACSFMSGACSAIHTCVYASLGIGFIIVLFYVVSWVFHWRQK